MQSETQKLILLARVCAEVGVRPEAMEDALTSGLRHFGEGEAEALAVHEWAAGLRRSKPHYFPPSQHARSTVPASPMTAATSQSQTPGPASLAAPRRQPPPDKVKEWAPLPPTERMTKARELKAQQEARVRGGMA
jgi:hypothetical protein